MLRAIAWSIWVLICAVILTAWIASYSRQQIVGFGRDHWRVGLSVSLGNVTAQRGRLESTGEMRFGEPHFSYKSAQPYPARLSLNPGVDRVRAQWQFHSFALEAGTQTESEWQKSRGPIPFWQMHHWRLILPAWFIFALVALPGSLLAIRARRRRQWDRQGRCPVCGYDLRATPDRCPECGRTAAAPAA